MKRVTLVFIFIGTTLFAQNFQSRTPFSGGLLFGYSDGFGLDLNFAVRDFAQDFPFDIKLSAAYAFVEPGSAPDARRIFINNATNGVPEKSGHLLELRMDMQYKVFGRNYVYFGPRYAMFTANFNFVGGNENFDVTSNQLGVGVGVENYFRISSAFDLVFNFGYSLYFENTLYGHDTSYSPNGEDVNPRENYTYDDADNAIEQPDNNFNAKLGFSFNF